MLQQTRLSVSDFVYPLFVKPGSGIKEPIESMDGCFHYSPDTVTERAKEIYELGIPAVLLFGQARKKNELGSDAFAEDAAVQQAVNNIKHNVPDLVVITDVCLCAYTDTGHCGIVKDGEIDNDQSCITLAKVALSHAKAGADMVAPSDMMDGRVKFIRETLDENNFQQTAIMAYSAKYCSAYYGPFRDAADSAPAFGDRKTYQMDYHNTDQAIREIGFDIEEGADIVMIKPALAYLDIILRARQNFNVPIAAYNVSGEYMMLNNSAKTGDFERRQIILETTTAIKRAGADIIISYFADEIARILNKNE
jgi:porphobilinogen synthase